MRLFFIIILLSIFISADEGINEQIKSLEQATPQERVELMNHIKEQLIEMNQNERMKTIAKLRAKLHPPKKAMGVEESEEHDKDKSQEEIKEEHQNSEADLKSKENHSREIIKDRIAHPKEGLKHPKEDLEHIREEFERSRENHDHKAPIDHMREIKE